MLHNFIINYKKIYNLFALEKFENFEKNAQNCQIACLSIHFIYDATSQVESVS